MAKRFALYGRHICHTVSHPFVRLSLLSSHKFKTMALLLSYPCTTLTGAARPARSQPEEAAQPRETTAVPKLHETTAVSKLREVKAIAQPRGIKGVAQPRGITGLARPAIFVQAHPTSVGVLTTQSAAL